MATPFTIALGQGETQIILPPNTSELELEASVVDFYRFGPAFAKRASTIVTQCLPPPSERALLHFADTFALDIGFRSRTDPRLRIACTSTPALTKFLYLTGDAVRETLRQHPRLTPYQLQQVEEGINSLLGPCGFDVAVKLEGR